MAYLDIFSINKQIHANNQNYASKPQMQKSYNDKIIESGIGSDEFFRILEKELPAIFSRQTASKGIGGLISAKTLSNLDSLGQGPERKIKIGTKVGYEKESFLKWLRGRFSL